MKNVIFVRVINQNSIMDIAAKKISIIERLMQVNKEATLNNYESLLIQAQLITRTDESIEAIESGQTITLDEFKSSNKQWLKEKFTK